MITSWEELGGGRCRVNFSDGIQEVYFLSALDLELFFTRFSHVATHCSFKMLQEVSDLVEAGGQEDVPVVEGLPNAINSDDLHESLRNLMLMLEI